MSLLTRQFEDMSGRCRGCYGRGHVDPDDSTDECGSCQGRGVELTDIGEELVEFLERHYGLKFKKHEGMW